MEVETERITTVEEAAKEASQSLHERIASHDKCSAAVRADLAARIKSLKDSLDALEKRVSTDLQVAYDAENTRLSTLATKIDAAIASSSDSTSKDASLSALVSEAHTELLVEQTYALTGCCCEVAERPGGDRYALKVNKTIVDRWLRLEKRRADGLRLRAEAGRVVADFHFLTDAEQRVLEEEGVAQDIVYRVSAAPQEEGKKEGHVPVEFVLAKADRSFVACGLRAAEAYCVRVRAEYKGIVSRWSEAAQLIPEFVECCGWRACPEHVDEDRRYAVCATNPRVATKTSYWNCTVVGDTPLPLGRVAEWGVRILRSRNNNGSGVCVGVAPADIDQNTDRNFEECGWYIDCYTSTLWSGLPQTLWNEEYGPRRGKGEYVREGSTVGVVVDTTKGELSFVGDGKNLGVAFRGIPLDKPLVPCVILFYKEDSIELVF